MTEQPELSNLPGSPGQKRKRDPESPSQQRAKRAAPPANMSVTPGDTAAYIESAIQATEAAAANGVNVADFNALQQATQEGSEAADPASATSTAQAALSMYPTLHVPPSTEEQFAAQAAAEAAEHNHDNSFNTPDVTQHQQQPQQSQSQPQTQPQPQPQQQQQQQQPPPQHDQQQPEGMTDEQPQAIHPSHQLGTNGVPQPTRFSGGASPPHPKPTVGSEEWHKMRKDNHKEGRPHCIR